MKVIRYTITLLEPTLVGSLDGDPNSATAFDYLPGSVLRGAIVGRYLQDLRQKQPVFQLDARNPLVRQLFFSGSTRYLNGYPLDRLKVRALPTPLSWQRSKAEESNIFDFAVEDLADDDEQWQSVGAPFCSVGGGLARLVQPARHVAVHTTRTRRFGRAMPAIKIGPDEIPGAVYRYDALAAGQNFEAVILCDADADAAMLLPLLSAEVRLGGSRSAAYGRAHLEVILEANEKWRETGGTPLTDWETHPLTVTLLSDTLLRDSNGQFATDPEVLTGVLARDLGVRLVLSRSFLGEQLIGGFNRKWGLPLPQALAIRRGSVFVYAVGGRIPADRLTDLETRGIGERRAEGFGRVAINWHDRESLIEDRTPHPREPVLQTDSLEPDEKGLAMRMSERLLRQRLDGRLMREARLRAISHPPSTAQLSRLRNIIQTELLSTAPGSPDPSRLDAFLLSVHQRSVARHQFVRARLGNETLLGWLERVHRIADDDEWRRLFQLRTSDIRSVGGIAAGTASLRAEYVLRLIDAVLARATKSSRDEE